MRMGWLLLLLCLPALGLAIPYTLGPEDVLAVTVLRHPELSLEVTVLADGTINYPVAGQVVAAGKTTQELAALLADGLKQELLEPQVTVTIKTPRPQRVYVNGEVGSPGIYDWKEGWRISEAIAAAGGLAIKPEAARTTVFRPNCEPIQVDLYDLYVHANRAANVPVYPQDSITITSATMRVFITGQVAKPGMYDVPVGAGVRQAVSLAGGLLPMAAGSRAYVIRGEKKIPVNLHQAMEQGNLEAEVALAPDDTVHVPENRDSLAVFGHVTKPGYYEIKDSDQVTVAKAISLAGGTDREADSRKVLVVREGAGTKSVITVNLHAIMVEGKVEQNIILQPSDIIFVCGKGKSLRNSDWLAGLSGLNMLRVIMLGF